MAVVQQFKLSLNINKNLSPEKIIVTANDNVEILVTLKEGRNDFPLLPEYTYKLVSKPRNKPVTIKDLEVRDGEIVAPLNHSETGYQLPVECIVQVFDDEGNRITSTKFDVVVLSDLTTGSNVSPSGNATFTIVNEEEFNRVSSMINEVEEARGKEESINARFDSVASQLAETTNKTEEIVNQIPISNILPNGNFNSMTGWEVLRGTSNLSGNSITVTGNSTGDNTAIRSVNFHQLQVGHSYYVKAEVSTTSNFSNSIILQLFPSVMNAEYADSKMNPEANKTYTLQGIRTIENSGDLELVIRQTFKNSTEKPGQSFTVKNVIVVDLTETFGINNIPNTREMDKIVSTFPEKWFEGTSYLASHLKGTFSSMRRTYPSTIVIAAYNSSVEDKSRADFVCDGINDEEEFNHAMEVFSIRSGKIVLCNGDYYIDSLYDSGAANIGKFGIVMKYPSNQREIVIEGTNAPVRRRTEKYQASIGPVIYLRDTLYNSLTETEKVTIIGALPKNLATGEIDYPSLGMVIKNIAIVIPANKKRITLIDAMYLSTFKTDSIIGSLDSSLMNFGTANIDCIGIRGLQGWNFGAGYRIDNCFMYGLGVCYDLAGEHLIANNLGCRFSLYSYRFNYYGTANRPRETTNCHPNTLINCCHEQCRYGPYFVGENISGQSWNFIDYNIEYESKNGWTQTVFAKEEFPGSFRGQVTYQVANNDYINDEKIPFWEDGSGIHFNTFNLVHKRVGTTTERPNKATNLGQQFFDTTLGKQIYLKNLSVKEINNLSVTSGANTSGNVTIILNGVSRTVSVSAGDTAEIVANKIRATQFYRWVTGGTGTTVTFKNVEGGPLVAPVFNSGSTGVVATMSTSTPGVNSVWVDANGTIV